jgi:4-hydroxyacetophenone monooxygenase
VEVRQDVHDLYNHRLDEKAQGMVWAHPGVTSWYKNDRNRLTVTSPWRLLDYWAMTRHFVPDEFRVADRPGQAPKVPGQRAEAVASADSLPVS